jgi:flagellar biosynthesis GTPase FlhF
MRILTLILALVSSTLAGCTTTNVTPEERAAREQQRAAQRQTDEQRQIAERKADEERQAAEERRHAEDDLRHKFIRYSTAELKLMLTRYEELRQSSGRDLNVNINDHLARKIWGDSDKNNIERVLEIERELLRRWRAGDAEAYLPKFEAIAPGAGKSGAP